MPPDLQPPALDHPLPAGMRDLLPAEARAQSLLARRLIGAFELEGYERVSLPAFEYADVLERGLGALRPDEVLRFVEPETGEVVALRPDMTPQIARLAATRMSALPRPIRLCYEGSVLRRRRTRARRHRQIPQAGVELIGLAAPAGDLEVVALAARAVRAAGLDRFVIDLAHARIAGSLIEQAPAPAASGLVEALALKDATELDRRAHAAGLEPPLRLALAALPELAGGEEIWERARAALGSTPAWLHVCELYKLWQKTRELGVEVVADLGETRHFAYYSGTMFQLLAEGPGEPIGSGGRYDTLLEKFGLSAPAAGFALDLDNLSWAVGASGARAGELLRVLVAAEREEDRETMLRELRACGIAAAPAGTGSPLDYARAWRFTHLIVLATGGATELLELASGARQILAARDANHAAIEAAGKLASST
jgi:ATP phosphoribosyltransferase regulatory subunit